MKKLLGIVVLGLLLSGNAYADKGHLGDFNDFLYDNENVYFLEINSQPGLTPISLVPEQFKYRNINFDTFIQHLINLSL